LRILQDTNEIEGSVAEGQPQWIRPVRLDPIVLVDISMPVIN